MPCINLPGQWDVFISHSQRDANATTLAVELYFSLKERGLAVWLDVKMSKRDEAAMEEGAKNSTMVVAIVTDGGIDKDNEDTAFFRRKYCLQELRWAKSAGVAIQPVLRVDDKKRVGEFIASAPDDLKDIGKVDWVDLNRGAVQYWNVGMDILVQRLEEANTKVHHVRQHTQAAAGKNGMHADALAALREMNLDKHADALFNDVAVTSFEDLKLVDEDIMNTVGFKMLEKKKFFLFLQNHGEPSVRQSSRAPPESSISTIRRGRQAIDSFKARGHWKKLANVRSAATRLHLLGEDQRSASEAIIAVNEASKINDAEQVVKTMRRHMSHADVQVKACSALAKLASQHPETLSRICDAEGVEAVVEAMRRHASDAGVQEQACLALHCLSVHKECVQSAIRAGAIRSVKTVMKNHPNKSGVVQIANSALNDLNSQNKSATNSHKAAISFEAAITAVNEAYEKKNAHQVVKTMKEHRRDAFIQVKACIALAKLAAKDTNTLMRVCDAEGVDAMVAAMRRHNTHAGVQFEACCALRHISANEQGKRRAQKAGVESAIDDLMRNHPKNSGVVQRASDVLKNIQTSTGSKAAIESIKEAEGRNNINAIIETMKLNVADADVQEQACWALRNLSANNSENKSRIGQAGGIEVVLSAMKRHQDQAGVQESACRALCNLSNHPENKSRIAQAGGIEAVLRAMKRHEDHAGVQEHACWALRNLSGNHPENQSRIAQAGGIEAVLSAMKGHENRAGVQEHACVVFFLISRNAECKRHAIDAGAIPAIQAAIRNHPNNDEVRTEAADALGRLKS
ncbi:armadillo repeat-containing protein [Pseudoscourfieldia marina]